MNTNVDCILAHVNVAVTYLLTNPCLSKQPVHCYHQTHMRSRSSYGGLLQSRSEWEIPAPHVRLQSDHDAHSPQWLSIASGLSPIVTHRPPKHHCTRNELDVYIYLLKILLLFQIQYYSMPLQCSRMVIFREYVTSLFSHKVPSAAASSRVKHFLSTRHQTVLHGSCINTSTHPVMNTSTPSTHQHIDTSTHQHIDTSINSVIRSSKSHRLYRTQKFLVLRPVQLEHPKNRKHFNSNGNA